MYVCWFFRSQIKQTLKKKAFEEAGIPVKQILIQVQQPQPHTSTSQEKIYVKNESQVLSAIPSTSTAIIVTHPLPPTELMVSDIKDESHDEVNLLTDPDVDLLSTETPSGSADESIDSVEIKMDEILTG